MSNSRLVSGVGLRDGVTMTQQSTDPRAAIGSWIGRARAGAALGPGLLICAAATAIAVGINGVLPAASPLLIAIVLGAVLTNAVQLPQRYDPGLQFSAKRLLRAGIALLGLQLLLGDIMALGWRVIVTVIAIVVLGILGTLVAGRVLNIGWPQRILIACGFSICGAAAVAAADGVVEAEEEEVLTGIALVVLFGTLMIPVTPMLAHVLGLSDHQAGMWAGGSIHEVAQVVATGGAIGGGALTVAVVIKLARVMMLAPVMAVLSLHHRRMAPSSKTRRPPVVPPFVLAFVGCVVLRSIGLLPEGMLVTAKILQIALLTAAMFALGAGVRLGVVAKVGVRPLILAAVSTVWVAAVAYVGVLFAG